MIYTVFFVEFFRQYESFPLLTNLAVVTAWMVATATKIAIIATTHQVPTMCSSRGQVLIVYFISINV